MTFALFALSLGPAAAAATVGVAKVTRSASTVAGCKSTTGTVTLTAAAPAEGASVSLSSSLASASVPASVVVPAGALTATFPIKTTPVAVAEIATLTAAYNATSKSTTLTVRPIGVTSLVVSPVAIAGGETASGRAKLECAAGPGPVSVSVASLNTAVASPTGSTITVPAGQTDGYFAVRAPDSAGDASAVLTARTSAGSTKSATLTVGPTPATTGAGGYARAEHVGMINPLDLYNASGLAHSVRNPGWIYLADDGAGADKVWAVRETGGAMTRLLLSDFVATDIEDLAVAPCGAGATTSCLFVGDIGDNSKVRTSITVLRVDEPDLSTYSGTQLASTRISLKYPSSTKRNAEALLVDDNGLPSVVTKDGGADKTGAARLFGPTSFTSQTMVSYGSVPVPVPTKPWTGNSNQVTGGDFKDGAVVLRTYDHAVEYRGAPGQSLRTFATWTKVEVPTPREAKAEAIGYRADGCGYSTASERVGDLWSIRCP